MTRHARPRRTGITARRATQTVPPLRTAPAPLEIAVSDATQTFAVAPAPPKPARTVSVPARFREVAAMEMAAIRERMDLEIQEAKDRAARDLAVWQELMDHVEATVPDAPEITLRIGRPPYEQPAIEADETVLTGPVVDIAFPGEPDLCPDPEQTLANIEAAHEEQDAAERGVA